MLTVDGEGNRFTGAIADLIGRMAPERALVVAAHVDDGESGTSISELDSLASGETEAAVGPEERDERPRGGRASQGHGIFRLHQTGLLHVDSHVSNRLCGRISNNAKGYRRRK